MSTDTRPDDGGTPAAPPVPPRPLYRAEALQALERADHLDQLLPVTSRRSWLAAVGLLLVLVAAVAYAAVTPRNVVVEGSGRVVGPNGVFLVTSSAAGQFVRYTVENLAEVKAGDVVAEVLTATGTVEQTAQLDGTVLIGLVRPGDPIAVGEWLAEMAESEDDGRTALLTVAPEEAGKVQAGMPVTVVSPDGPTVTGTVGEERSQALAADRVQEGLGLLEPPPGPQVVLLLNLDSALQPGSEVTGTILVSKRSLLQQLLGMS